MKNIVVRLRRYEEIVANRRHSEADPEALAKGRPKNLKHGRKERLCLYSDEYQ